MKVVQYGVPHIDDLSIIGSDRCHLAHHDPNAAPHGGSARDAYAAISERNIHPSQGGAYTDHSRPSATSLSKSADWAWVNSRSPAATSIALSRSQIFLRRSINSDNLASLDIGFTPTGQVMDINGGIWFA